MRILEVGIRAEGVSEGGEERIRHTEYALFKVY
jgi:hypothetical protein